MREIASFELPKWTEAQKPHASLVLAGSAPPALSIQNLVSLSTDRPTTTQNLYIHTLPLSLGTPTGGESLRRAIAAVYEHETITSDHILTTTGTTDANAIVFQTLLRAEDHVIVMYPSYPQLYSLPGAIVDEVSLWRFFPSEKSEEEQIRQLEEMIQPNTRMIVLNDPNNPIGTVLSSGLRERIITIAQEKKIIVFVDEIFRPIFYDKNKNSIDERSACTIADNVIVTSSLSKAWALPGVRVGWIATRNSHLLGQCTNLRFYMTNSLGAFDEIVATEALSERIRPQILRRHLRWAQTSVSLLQAFVDEHPNTVSWVTRPVAGSMAFLKFTITANQAVDDVDFCMRLNKQTGVLLAPGSLCFGCQNGDFKGCVRINLMVMPDVMSQALMRIHGFLLGYLAA
ncbi:hypothetical protein ASPZODRAFT_142594 [Penicilliopsis zonata CBS 506.65]|uniref:Aminotransferase class I/classII large domain-containing protein n=1 Tax=Penicilliopsis zonata CBS 506.65 TaxID=1073090 RepID=A0A1L9SHV3_9EURO|nr:hypothetical protein ASPZODRAFT_142594 [Penicilliopsis zonata CBS 506.65]OJJ46800.1 hypothetical protein ASPZODRAFT_142594 [Penicilliopsis zonata CBS 506.65]